MPYKSEKQRRFFKMCEKNPKRAKAKCPPKRVIKKYEKHRRKK